MNVTDTYLQSIFYMPADQLPNLPSPADEPNVKVRRLIAQRLPPERLPDLPTVEAEPDAKVRWWIAHRLPIERLSNMPMLSEEDEPDFWVRLRITCRLADRDSQ